MVKHDDYKNFNVFEEFMYEIFSFCHEEHNMFLWYKEIIVDVNIPECFVVFDGIELAFTINATKPYVV